VLSLFFVDRRQNFTDHLLAVDNSGQVTFAVQVAFLIVSDVQQQARMGLGGQADVLHGGCKGLRVKLTDLLRHRLDRVHADVALQAIVVRASVEFLLERSIKFFNRILGGVGRQAHMCNGAIGRIARELNHLLAGQDRLANDGLFVPLLFQLFQQTLSF